MCKGRSTWHRKWADLARRTQPQIDTQDISIRRIVSEQLDDPARISLCSLAWIVARAARQKSGIIKQNGVNIRRVVQLARALLTQRQRNHAVDPLLPNALGNGGSDGPIQCMIGKVAQSPDHFGKRIGARKITYREDRGQSQAFAAQARCRVIMAGLRSRPFERRRISARLNQCSKVRLPVECTRKERGVCACALKRVRPIGCW